jgi:hypothetical protein
VARVFNLLFAVGYVAIFRYHPIEDYGDARALDARQLFCRLGACVQPWLVIRRLAGTCAFGSGAMTPLERFYSQFVTARWIYPSLTLSYLLGLLALVLLARNPAEMIIYVDLRTTLF